jgi:hypothetical protein
VTSLVKALWSRLTSKAVGSATSEPSFDAVDYKGCRIRPAPYQSSGGYQTAGVIEKDFPDGLKKHPFVRAETYPSRDDAAAFAIAKGRQIIDQHGDRVFDR